MSLKDNPCRKFQANIFNKSKCQNCFKPRESHLLNDEDLNQAKPTYAGWLLLAPEGTNFDNPLHRSRTGSDCFQNQTEESAPESRKLPEPQQQRSQVQTGKFNTKPTHDSDEAERGNSKKTKPHKYN